VQNLALLMVDPQGNGLNPHDHWQKTAYSLLVGCILHFSDLRPIDGLGEQEVFTLPHGGVQLAAEQALSAIGTFEAERQAKR